MLAPPTAVSAIRVYPSPPFIPFHFERRAVRGSGNSSKFKGPIQTHLGSNGLGDDEAKVSGATENKQGSRAGSSVPGKGASWRLLCPQEGCFPKAPLSPGRMLHEGSSIPRKGASWRHQEDLQLLWQSREAGGGREQAEDGNRNSCWLCLLARRGRSVHTVDQLHSTHSQVGIIASFTS